MSNLVNVSQGLHGDWTFVTDNGERKIVNASNITDSFIADLAWDWRQLHNGIASIKDEIFSSEEEAWKGQWADDAEHKAFIKGLELALKLLEAEDER